MGVKTIYLDTNISLVEWVDDNKSIIIETLYENIFDFYESELKTKTVLKITNKPTVNYNTIKSHAVVFDFMLLRDDISLTIRSLLDYYESAEEYEKCAKLVDLQNKL